MEDCFLSDCEISGALSFSPCSNDLNSIRTMNYRDAVYRSLFTNLDFATNLSLHHNLLYYCSYIYIIDEDIHTHVLVKRFKFSQLFVLS